MKPLELSAVSRHFGGVKAVEQVSMKIEPRQITGIIGPNGAGKSTLFNLISRLYDLSSGQISLGDQDISRAKKNSLARMGIARTFQNIELFNRATVLDNLLTAQFIHRQTSLWQEFFYTPAVKKQETAFRRRAEEMIDFFELAHYRHQPVAALPYGIRKLTEIARALCLHPEILLLDEPSSGLNQEETDDLSHWILDIKKELGITVLLIDHNINLIGQVTDYVYAMAEGRVIASGPIDEVREDPQVIAAYLGG